MKKGIFGFMAILAVFALTMGCSSGGGGGSNPPPAPPGPPGPGPDVPITVTFNYNYAETDADYTDMPEPIQVFGYAGEALGDEFPETPERDPISATQAFAFIRWSLDADGDDDEAINADTIFDEDTDVYAIWRTYDPTTTAVVSFHLNNGAENDLYENVLVTKGQPIGTEDFPEDPEWEGYDFIGWATTGDATSADFTSSTRVDDDMDVYAIWEEESETVPELGDLANASYEVNSTESTELRIPIRNLDALGGLSNLSFQWYKASTAEGEGTTVGTNSRDFSPPVNVAGTTWYWVVVTNVTTNDSATSNRARIIVYTPSADTAVEFIVSNNSSIPLWEFKLPNGANWADYEEFSIEYYVSKFSKAATPTVNVRSRLYGAYILGDLETPDQNQEQGWGLNGGAGQFKIINWNNSTTITRPGETSVNPNNNFILDNARGSASPLTTLFTAEGGGPSRWFKVKYAANGEKKHNDCKNYAVVTLLDKNVVDTIFVGAGIFQSGSDASGNYEFYVKNPTLVNKEDPNKNIVGSPRVTGDATSKLFAGNGGAGRNGTNREVLATNDNSYVDNEGDIRIDFDLKGGSGNDFPAFMKITAGNTLPATFFALTNPTRVDYDFGGWYFGEGDAAAPVTSTTTFSASTTVWAKWDAQFSRLPHPYPTATEDTIISIGPLNGNLSSNNQPGWVSGDDSFSPAEFAWATSFQFTLAKAFTGGCRFNWGNEADAWSTASHDTAITSNTGVPTEGILSVEEQTIPDPAEDAADGATITVYVYTIDLTKLALYDDMIMTQTKGELFFQYWGGGDFTNFATIKPTDAKLIIPPPEE